MKLEWSHVATAAKLVSVVLCVTAAFKVGQASGLREAPRTVTDRQAAERWSKRCSDRNGWPDLEFQGDGEYKAACNLKRGDVPKIEVE